MDFPFGLDKDVVRVSLDDARWKGVDKVFFAMVFDESSLQLEKIGNYYFEM